LDTRAKGKKKKIRIERKKEKSTSQMTFPKFKHSKITPEFQIRNAAYKIYLMQLALNAFNPI